MIVLFLFFLCQIKSFGQDAMSKLFEIPFETNPNQTLTYEQTIACYARMAEAYPAQCRLEEAGPTDSGRPLHVAIFSHDGLFDPAASRSKKRLILLINNGIHPGEPEGIDATVMLLRDLLERDALPRHVTIVCIPVYNIDGCLNRNAFSRANQNGPASYGFRGNARNYDLNRDFVKADSRNARSFNAIFTRWRPDVFVDNHTSNGADYQYVMTLIATQHNKLEAPLGQYLHEVMKPWLYEQMAARNWEMIPYVDGPGPTPEAGIREFCDHGRYSTGYAALFNTIGFMPETHMLKPFADRLYSNLAFMEVVLDFCEKNCATILAKRAEAFAHTRTKTNFALDWALDASRCDSLLFKGYAAKYKPSEVSGLPRLWYDRSAPFEKKIPFYPYFKPVVSVEKPAAYIVPQAWEEVIQRLQLNGVSMQPLSQDTTLEVEMYRIGDFKTRPLWEGHYFHYDVKFEIIREKRQFHRGDMLVPTDQDANRYIVETLEPHAPDSWFAWNFFDAILMQKEYFSAYVFEDLAAQYLRQHPELRAELEAQKKADPAFAEDARAQLDWVYKRSPWYEPSHKLYPVARVIRY